MQLPLKKKGHEFNLMPFASGSMECWPFFKELMSYQTLGYFYNDCEIQSSGVNLTS